MIQVSSVTKEFASRILFQEVTFSINRNERVGLVGRNGTGKSTLLKIINQEIEADEGEVSIPSNYSIEMLKQHIDFTKTSVIDECMQVLPSDEKMDFYKAEKILFGLGFAEDDLHKNPLSFSGGYQIRITLTKCLLRAPDMLLLDEPTNYLDIVSMKWLEKFLRKYPGEMILITHDRDFMNSVCTHTMGIHRNKLVKIKGDYNHYWTKIQEDEKVYENTRQNHEKKKKNLERFITKFRAKARQASLAQSRQKMLEKMEEFDKLENISSIKFEFNYKDFPAKTLLQAENIAFGYQEQALFENLSFHINKGDKVAIIGKNGKGKSTLLNLISGALSLNVQTGTINRHSSVSIGHFGQTNIETLHPTHSVEQEIMSTNPELSKTQVRNICGSMMFSDQDAEKKISVLSGGEKSRVLLGKILAQKTNLLLLDEPTNHLDQETIEILLVELKKFPGAVVIVTHNERLLRKIFSKFIVFHQNRCEEFQGSYDDFLDKIGWEEEFFKKTETSNPKIGHKQYKHQRSELIKERSFETKPLKDKIESLENKIVELEQKVEDANHQLVLASENNEAEKIQFFSKELASAQLQIEESFTELQSFCDQLQQLENVFDTKLQILEQMKKS